MKRLTPWLALTLIVAVNTLALTGVARNRLEPPDAQIRLSERELFLDIPRAREETTALALVLDWRDTYVSQWFNEAKLAEVGFDLQDIETSDHAFSRRPLARPVFVVLEYEGESWNRYGEEQRREAAEIGQKLSRGEIQEKVAENRLERIEADLGSGSRLFAMDAAADPLKLRQTYPDGTRHLIVPALARMNMHSSKGGVEYRGHIASLLVDRIHVPRDEAQPLLELSEEPRFRGRHGYSHPPRFEAEVHWGRRLEPWIADIRILTRR